MSCHKADCPDAAIQVIKAGTGKTLTGDQWHEVKKIANESELNTSRAKATEEEKRAAMEKLVNAAVPQERVDLLTAEQQVQLQSNLDAQIQRAVDSDATYGNVAVLELIGDRGLEDVLAEADERIAAKRAEKKGEEAPKSTGKDGTEPPPLSAEIHQGRATYRLYAIDPETKAQMEMGFLSMDDAINSGRAFPSITTCLGALDKPALPQWAAGVAADYGNEVLEELSDCKTEAEMRDKLASLLEVDPKSGRTEFRKTAGNAHNQKRDKAAARGTEVHAYAEAIMRGDSPEVPEEMKGYVDAARAFREEYPDMKFVYTEATVYNPEARTMGTTDGIVELGGKRYILDWKTNEKAAVYSSVGMQLSAAANAESIVNADGSRVPMPKIDGGLGVGLGPDGNFQVFKFETEREGANHNGFKAARSAWEWKSLAGRDPRPSSREDLLR